jgi:hypothetical protein
MEISEVKRRLRDTVERARRAAAERREHADLANREFPAFLETVAVPIFKQAAAVLKAERYLFTVFTPGGSVRLMSDRSADDFIELILDTSGPAPLVIGRTSRGRGHRILESERPIATGPVRDLTEEQVLTFLAEELEPFVER